MQGWTRRGDVKYRLALEHGVIGGVIAGLAFLVFETFLIPFRYLSPMVPVQMFASLVLGPGVLPPGFPTVLTTLVGILVVVGLSAIYGVILAVIATAVPALRTFPGIMIGTGIIYGLLLWFINFVIVAPALFPWFVTADPFSYPFSFAYVREFAQPVFQLVSHTVFGLVLGYYLETRLGRTVATE